MNEVTNSPGSENDNVFDCNIPKILKEAIAAKDIFTFFENNNTLERRHRKIIVATIVKHFYHNNITMSLVEMHRIASIIENIFPCEDKVRVSYY